MENKKEINEKELDKVDGGMISKPIYIDKDEKDNTAMVKKIKGNENVDDAQAKKKRIW